MTDRELLELAAKAAGIEIYFDEDGGSYRVKASGNRNYWNPLLFDGDALRLAVQLGLNVIGNSESTVTVRAGKNPDVSEVFVQLQRTDDPYAATRRAIVRAAAELARSME